MSENLRTFIAVKINPVSELIDFINEWREVFEGETIKWVDKDNLHLTLKFLGKTSKDQISEIENILMEIASQHFNFSFDLRGIGYFKTRGFPSVLFVGINDFWQMKVIAEELENRLSDLGLVKDKREFKPHLTIGRIKYLKNKKRFYEFVEKYKDKSIQKVLVSGIIFYQSILKQQGPEYIPLQITQLNS